MAWCFGLLLLCSFAVVSRGQYDPGCSGKQVIVHLFEWKWTDIAAECERWLGPKGFCGVQTSPPNEHVIKENRPWWERYQPVSYKLVSRSGDEAQFRDMVSRCNAVGVRIFTDVVINHMAGLGQTGTGTAGSRYDSSNFDFPGVPYGRNDFNTRDRCPSDDGNINNYNDANNVRNCLLLGLTDLNQGIDYVRGKIVDYLNHMTEIGVAGFRVDAAKHMWPGDMAAIFSRLNGRPFIYQEVIGGSNEAITVGEYENMGYVTEFNYCGKLASGIRNFRDLNDIDQGMLPSNRALVCVDNHDNQRGGGGVLTHRTPREYKMAVAFMLAHPYGFTRVMSSFGFHNAADSPPHNDDYSTKDVPANCGDGWICEHRWRPISNMVAFRNYVDGAVAHNWHNQNNEIAFSRGDKGFFAMTKSGHMDRTLNTGLPPGDYCDLISECSTTITVGGDGRAQIRISNRDEPIIAIITGDAPTGSPFTGPTVNIPTVNVAPDITSGWHRTVIFVQKTTRAGQDLFIRGGIDHTRRQGCTDDASSSACAISIRRTRILTCGHFAKYNAWAEGDTKLDWYGAQSGQGSYHGREAAGTPSVWTTNTGSGVDHSDLNSFGQHYWQVDVEMDCSDTDNGWFEVKAMLHTDWESDVNAMQGLVCGGTAGGVTPYASNNHFARCGYVNVFAFGVATCTINQF